MSLDIIYDYMEANPDDPFGGPDEILAWADKELAALREQVKVLREALEGARIFIVDGLEFWCVEQPEPGKQAFDALNGIYRALAQTKPKDGE